jgi:hypothetical protein
VLPVAEALRACGLSNVLQIRPIVDLDGPVRSAIFARDQCVALLRCRLQRRHDHVLDLLSRDRRGPTGPRVVAQPIHPASTNRARHFPTVAWTQPSRAATALLSSPSAHTRG